MTQQLNLRVSPELVEKLEKVRVDFAAKNPGARCTLSDAARMALSEGTDRLLERPSKGE